MPINSPSLIAAPYKPPRCIDFAARIRAERARLNLSQTEVAELASMTREQYKQLELRAGKDIRVSTLRRLIRAGYRLEAIAPELIT
jgi:transcriptional regulator with XRE-family HTH domain